MAKAVTEEKTDAGTEEPGQIEQNAEEETVPMARFEEMVADRDSANERATVLTQQQAIIQANQSQKPVAKQFDIYAEVGLDPDDPEDIPNQKQLKQIQEYNSKQIMTQMAELQFLSTHPDYNEIVGTDEGIRMAQFAPPLAKAIKENPALLQLIISSPNRRETAYQIAKLAVEKPAAKVDATDAKNAIDEAVKNATQVKSSSNVAGGSGVLSEAGRIESMDEDAFLELARKNGAPI